LELIVSQESEPTTVPDTSPPVLQPLSVLERRVLGVLVEKSKTTPDAYPLTLNALVTGCNQKNNRDPVMNVDAGQVEDTLERLRARRLVQQIQGSGRTDKFRHALYDEWYVGKVELSVVTELLLRGPQTEGELRVRASRMDPIPDLESLRTLLNTLTERRFVVFLSPQGRRGTTLTHGFHATEELERLRSGVSAAANLESEASVSSSGMGEPSLSERVRMLESAVERLRQELAELRAKVVL
jgi:uncharacterized protein YceH (UPF0502 family)